MRLIHAAISTILLSGCLGLPLAANAQIPQDAYAPDDGTYHSEVVSDRADCKALCEADKPKCRGSVTMTQTTTFTTGATEVLIECRLNNGYGENAVFPFIPPEPLDMQIAISDLNVYRAQNGLGPVVYNAKLNAASQAHAADLAQAGIISHTGTDGSTPAQRAETQGYEYSIVAENVATGQMSWNDVFDGWQKSPGHDANLLREGVTEFGIALVYEPKTELMTYWAMLVASPPPEPYWTQSQPSGTN